MLTYKSSRSLGCMCGECGCVTTHAVMLQGAKEIKGIFEDGSDSQFIAEVKITCGICHKQRTLNLLGACVQTWRDDILEL